jgi:hypothetical protein
LWPGDEISGAEGIFDDLCRFDKKFVADGMPEGIIDHFKAVDISHRYGQRQLQFRIHQPDVFLKEPAVVYACELVMIAQIDQPFFRNDPVGDIQALRNGVGISAAVCIRNPRKAPQYRPGNPLSVHDLKLRCFQFLILA